MALTAVPKKRKVVNTNPYGSLGPSPQTVTRINAQLGLTPAGLPKYTVPGTAAVPGWGSPEDYGNAITSQPDYALSEADLNQANLDDERAAQESMAQYALGFGGNLSGLVGKGLITDETARQAAGNQFSFMGELSRALGRANEGDVSNLAARGALNSGAAAVQAGLRQEDYQRQSNTGLADLEGKLRGVQAGLAGRKNDRLARFRSTYNDIATRISQQPQYQPRDPIPATPAVPWGGVSWGGRTGIFTKAQLVASLAPGVTYAQWARNHPDAAKRLT